MGIEIEGHTDSVIAQSYNLKLSKTRAESVCGYLGSKGVSPERMSVNGFGKYEPVADNKTQEGRDQNRRVEFKISTP